MVAIPKIDSGGLLSGTEWLQKALSLGFCWILRGSWEVGT